MMSKMVKVTLRAVETSDKNISIFDDRNRSHGMVSKDQKDRIMYRYGRSKVMHWNTRCAQSSSNTIPTEIKLLDGKLAGLRTCQNCWDRTRCLPDFMKRSE